MRCRLALTLVLVLAACGGDAKPKVVKALPLPGSVVEADGHRVYFDCEGSGSPTVVFLAGWGADDSSWLPVFTGVSRRTRACEYDRFGLGQTATYGALPNTARNARDQVRELEQLLDNADIGGPYVVVGHSWGGALARLYTGTHDDVKGAVFVDAASPGQNAAIARALPPAKPSDSATIQQLRALDVTHPLRNPENLDWFKSLDEVARVDDLGERPLVVITAGNTFEAPAPALSRVWMRLQNRLARLSQQSVHVVANASSHEVQTDAPELVQAAVLAVVASVRDGKRLAPCAAIFAHVETHRCA